MNAVKLAMENARRHWLTDRICFFVGEWFQSLNVYSQPFDMIISNPPYIKTKDIGQLQPEVCEYEPHLALNGGDDGLQWIRHIICVAHRYLKAGGFLVLEMGYDQREEIQRIIETTAWYDRVIFSKDYSGHDRIVQIRKKGNC
jgi:release factor glutamine methyltransferase